MPTKPTRNATRPIVASPASGWDYSNLTDCQRYGCDPTPWNWASRWVLEQVALSGDELVVDLGAGDNPLLRKAWRSMCRHAMLIDLDPSARADQPSHAWSVGASADALPLSDDTVDALVSVSVMEHLTPEQRLSTMMEIQRVLRPGGRAAITIGVLFHANEDARWQLRTMPFFTDRHCSVHFPLNVSQMLARAPKLRVAGSTSRSATEMLPGGSGYDEMAVLARDDLCVEAYRDYPQLRVIPSLAPIVIAELGLLVCKQGMPA